MSTRTILNEYAQKKSYDLEELYLLLCMFVDSLVENADIPTGFDPHEQLNLYLENQDRADEEMEPEEESE